MLSLRRRARPFCLLSMAFLLLRHPERRIRLSHPAPAPIPHRASRLKSARPRYPPPQRGSVQVSSRTLISTLGVSSDRFGLAGQHLSACHKVFDDGALVAAVHPDLVRVRSAHSHKFITDLSVASSVRMGRPRPCCATRNCTFGNRTRTRPSPSPSRMSAASAAGRAHFPP